MSLQLAAQHLSNQGRGPDDTLVHMSSREVKSLSDLAQAHGGQLTVNPHTGLPEAGLLDSLLPTIIGAGVSYFSGGTISPAMIGLGVGGIQALRTGSLEKGLMAGLGAYGGAGITAGLSGVGEAAIGMNARDAAVASATEQGLTGEAYNKAIQNQVTQQMAEKATPFGNISAGTGELFKNPMETLGNMGGQGGGMAGAWQTAKYAAGAAAPYLAEAYQPTTDMPDSAPKPTEYRQYKVKRRPDLSYEYTPLPVSNTFTPNFAEGGGISDAVTQYVDPSFKFKNVSGPPKISTTTEMPQIKLAEGGRITPEEFYQMYMQQPQTNTRVQDLKYGVRGYPNDVPSPIADPYKRPEPTPADITGTDGVTYTWDAASGKYVAKPGSEVVKPTDSIATPTSIQTGSGGVNPQQSQINAFFDSMTPAQLQAFQEGNSKFINNLLTPLPIKMLQDALKSKTPAEATPTETTPTVESEGTPSSDAAPAEGISNISPLAYPSLALSKMKDAISLPLGLLAYKMSPAREGSPAPVRDAGTMLNTPDGFTKATVTVGEGEGGPSVNVGPSVTSIGGDGGDGVGGGFNGIGITGSGFGVGGNGIAGGITSSPGAPTGVTAANSGSGEGGMNAGGGGRGAPGATAPGSTSTGTTSGTTSGTTGGDGGGGVGPGGVGFGGATASPGSGTSCCFIMLEARYGDGTMDSVVRRYRDEKMTDKNRRGYYKLAEVFVPLMRESKLFKFMVTKTFADPLVSYGKYHYGENKHGWLFKPVEKFWMKVFNTLGSDTKFIRENGEVV